MQALALNRLHGLELTVDSLTPEQRMRVRSWADRLNYHLHQSLPRLMNHGVTIFDSLGNDLMMLSYDRRNLVHGDSHPVNAFAVSTTADDPLAVELEPESYFKSLPFDNRGLCVAATEADLAYAAVGIGNRAHFEELIAVGCDVDRQRYDEGLARRYAATVLMVVAGYGAEQLASLAREAETDRGAQVAYEAKLEGARYYVDTAKTLLSRSSSIHISGRALR